MSKKQVVNRKPGTFKPGQSGNPNGRPPKGYSITEMMREMLASKPEIKDAIGKVIAQKAMEGDRDAIRLLWQYMDGMPSQSVDLTSKGEQLGAYKELPEEKLDELIKLKSGR